MYESIREMLVRLIADVIAWITEFSGWMIETSLKVENAAWIVENPLTVELIDSLYRYVYFAVLALVALKFLWKGFQVYVLWRDGDAEVSPHNLLMGAVIALVAALAFPTLYDIGVSATVSIGNGLITTINESWDFKPIVIRADYDAQATALWNKYFAEYDTNGDRALSQEEFSDFRKRWLPNRIEGKVEGDWDEDFQWFVDGYSYTEVGYAAYDAEKCTYQYLVNHYNEVYVVGLEERLAELSLAGVLVLLIYFILYVIMFVRLLGRGIEMLFLRLGFPIAAIGYIDSDGGISTSYVQLLLRQMATSILQVTALYLSFYVAMHLRLSHILMGLAMIGVAFYGPVLLSQIIAPQKQGGGFGTRLHSVLMLRQLVSGRR